MPQVAPRLTQMSRIGINRIVIRCPRGIVNRVGKLVSDAVFFPGARGHQFPSSRDHRQDNDEQGAPHEHNSEGLEQVDARKVDEISGQTVPQPADA